MTALARLLTAIALAALFATALVPSTPALAHPQQATPPRDPAGRPPAAGLDDLWMDFLDCDCDCECCEDIKARAKARLKDPRHRPLPAPGSERGRRDVFDRDDRRHPRGHERVDRNKRHGRHGRMGRHGMRRAWAKKERGARIDLSDEQRDRIRELSHRHRMESIDLNAALQKKRLELRRLMGEKSTDADTLRRHVDAMAKIRADIEFNKLQSRLEMRGVLNDEQRTKLRKRR